MVAYLFLSPAPYTPPAMPLIVLLRFLSLLSSFDWSTEPLIVNFNNELSGTARTYMFSSSISEKYTIPIYNAHINYSDIMRVLVLVP